REHESGRAVEAPASASSAPVAAPAGPARAGDASVAEMPVNPAPNAVREVEPRVVASSPSAARGLERFEILVPGTTAKLALAPIPASVRAAAGRTPIVGPFF